MPTTIADYTALAPELIEQVPNLPLGVAIAAIRKGAVRFCKDTLCWNEVLPPMLVVGYQRDYTLSFSDDAYVQSTVRLFVQGVQFQPQTYELVHPNTMRFNVGTTPDCDESYDAYDATLTYAMNDIVTTGSGSTYQIWTCKVNITTPEAFDATHWYVNEFAGIRVTVSLVPNANSVGVSLAVLNRFEHGILAAAKVELFKQSEKPWSPAVTRRGMSPLLQAAQRDYADAEREAKALLATGGGAGTMAAATSWAGW